METLSTVHLILWLVLPLAFVVIIAVGLWRAFKKRPVKRWFGVAASVAVIWVCLSPVFGWFLRRELMEMLFGQAFYPKLIYSHTPPLEFNGDGTSLYIFEIPRDRISSLTNATALKAMGLPRKDFDMEAWQTIHWQYAPFSNDTNDIQFLAFSCGGEPKFGVSDAQLQELMKLPSTIFACSYKTFSGQKSETNSNPAYMTSFYIMLPDKQQLIVIFSKI